MYFGEQLSTKKYQNRYKIGYFWEIRMIQNKIEY